ncbi:MAG: hypothetical protein GX323_04510 [Clostridiales bacterium]|nr:hypothetical protein [Clostridiales bacterium]
MLFGRRKPGFIKVEEGDGILEEVTEKDLQYSTSPKKDDEAKVELTDFLASLPDVEDPYEGIDVPEQEAEEEEEEVELTKAQELAEYIRLRSAGGEVTKYQDLKAEIEDLDELLEEMKEDETCSDITYRQGVKDKYYYSTSNMSENYSMIISLVEDKDIVATIAKMVRFNAKTYPSPTPLEYFERHPYFYSRPQIERACDLISSNEEYGDIERLTNNVGVDFLFSNKYLSRKYANALATDDEFTD